MRIFQKNRPRKKISVLNVHTETSTMGRNNRLAQVDTIIAEARVQVNNSDIVFIGGDFNTLFPNDAKQVVQKLNDAGFSCATDTAGHTAEALFGLIKPKEDYIFYKGVKALHSGKLSQSRASDHYPMYAVFRSYQ